MSRCCLFFVTSLTLFVPATFSQDKMDTCKVVGTLIIPEKVASFESRLVEIRLYKYDPRLAEVAADLVEKVEFKDFSHTTGKATKKEFVIGAKAKLEPMRSYYVTCFIVDKGKRTHMGKCVHDMQGIGKVLTNGQPNKITIEVHELKK